MAIRTIINDKDEILRKKSREVTEFNQKLWTLLDDMAETMYRAEGVGLAAVQVGVLRRVTVIDAGEKLYELINPVIVKESGEQTASEGCLSSPNEYGDVSRPMQVTVNAVDRIGKPFTLEGTELLARALCHEIDHMDGVLFKDKATNLEYEEPQPRKRQK